MRSIFGNLNNKKHDEEYKRNDSKTEIQETNDSVKLELINSVRSHFSHYKNIDQIKRSVLNETGLDENYEVRRDYDGVSGVGYLIYRMIGELLIDGRIQR